ncbi:MAG: diacylglycerol kinase family lipid kinase [Chlorobiaceae bacterium]|nr:diacylglycerol kinase family lipid kinase [Chlorobiaceae bacterium]
MGNRLRYTFIFNPAADKGRAAKRESWLRRKVSALHGASLLKTSYPGHAGELALRASTGCDCLIACGGDGTVHEVVNAVAGHAVSVGVLPIGSANDFVKILGSNESSEDDFTSCLSGSSRRVDLGSVLFNEGDHRLFVNSLGVGFTGRIAGAVKRMTWLKGELSYVHALFSVLIGYTPLKMHITITAPDFVLELHEPVFAFSVSNGSVEGGRFRIAPEADPADGLLDVCILKSISKLSFLRYVVKYLRGSQSKDPKVISCKASAVEVAMEDPDVMHMDGEVFDVLPGNIRISVVSRGLVVVSGSQING